MGAEGGFESILSGDNVEVTCGEGAARIEFGGCAAYEDGRADALRVHMLADGGEDFERCGKFWAVGRQVRGSFYVGR